MQKRSVEGGVRRRFKLDSGTCNLLTINRLDREKRRGQNTSVKDDATHQKKKIVPKSLPM